MSELVREALASRAMAKSPHECGSCGESLECHQPVYLVYISRPEISSGKVLLNPSVIDDDFEYYPYFFHEKCWEESVYELETYVTDVPECGNSGTTIGNCFTCYSDMPSDEVCLVFCRGQFQLSDRAPNRQFTLEFVAEGTPWIVCSVCANELNHSVVENLWGEKGAIKQGTECAKGAYTRCWRSGLCKNGCQHERKTG